ncbi:TUBGCP2 isoform 8 [Pongo abelii]|uniref:TUBGCP2 isoform 8 n=1 Tax=Pongo abelii TaxID=9601 RepID=A0A2J8TAN1_PONAB|nr:TUBGCP2 isoform 8 [Pongo abelii]
MSEFRIHHDVNELLSLLRVHGGDGAEVYIDLLQKNRTPYVTTTVSAHSAKAGMHMARSCLIAVSTSQADVILPSQLPE